MIYGKQKLIYVESKAQFSPSEVSDKAIVFIKDTKEIWTHGVYFSCSGAWATPITLTLSGDSAGSVSIDGSGNVTLLVANRYLHCTHGAVKDANSALSSTYKMQIFSEFAPSFANGFPATNYANAIININTHSQNYDHQLGFSSNKGIYHRTRSAGTWETSWREILTSTNYTNYPHTFASLTNKPTTISGYGITDSIPIINGGKVTTDTDLSTLGMTTIGAKLSVNVGYEGYPSWLNAYSNFLMFRGTTDTYSGIATDGFNGYVTFVGGRNLETTTNNAPNWWYRIKGNSGTTYDLNSFQNTINNLDSNYLRKSGGTMTGNIILTTNSSSIYDSASSYELLGANIAGNATTGLFAEKGVYVGKPDSQTTIRSSGDDLWHYRNSDASRYKILDANNYTTYALPLTGGTLTGTLTSSNITPRASITYDIGTTSAYYNNIYAQYFKRKDSSDSYVLLGGGGHKAISDFVLTSSLNNYVTLSTDQTVSGKKQFNNQLIIRKDVGDADSKVIDIQHDLQLQVRRDSNTHSVAIGVMPTGSGVIWAKANGIGYNTLYLNPYNNGVAIGCGGNGALPNLNDGYYFHIFGSTLSNNSITATKFIKSGGTASQFLKADGSLDSNAYLPLSGGTMTGALNFANNTWNKVGDDAYIGDCNVGGMLGIKGSYAYTPGFAMYNSAGTLLGKLYASGTSLYWSDAKILTASGTSTQFVMGDGSLYSDTVSHTTWTKTTTSGTAWFPIADITDDKQGTALFMVKAYAHSSIIFTVVKGMTNGNINVLAGGGQFNNSYAYIRGVRQIGNVVEIGLNAAATYVSVVIKVLQPTFTYSLRSSLVESTNTATPYVQYDINSGGNHNFGIISSKFTGNLIGNADTASKWVTARTITLTGDVTGSVTLDGSSNVTLATTTSGTGTTSFLKCPDKRNSYPAQIVTSGQNIGASFMTASKLGISGDGSYYDTLIIRGYSDSSGGSENAIMFSKNTSSVYHSQYAFGSTTTWGTLYKFLDSGNYKNYAPSLSGEGATGTWGISISGTANKVANALTLQLNGGTTSGTNKFVYDGLSAYTVNITPASIGAAATSHNHDDAYLKLTGGTLGSSSASSTELRTQSSTATLRFLAWHSSSYIQSGNSAFTGNTPLKLTGYSDTIGSSLYFKFNNIYCRGNDYINIDSGNYGSYALPKGGGTMTGAISSMNITPKDSNTYTLGSTSSYYKGAYSYGFYKNGSSDSYVLLGGGGHKAVSDFTLKEQKSSTSISGNTDQWSIILEQSYPADHWYDVVNTFLVEGAQFGSGFLSFYAYWQATSSAFKDYITEVYFNGTMRGETTAAFGGSNRDINDYLRIYIDKTNYKLLVYANHYNGKTVRIKRINYNEIDTSGFPNGGILVEHFNDKGTIVSLPTESSTMTRVLIKTHYNHDRTIKTSKSIYASSFYENSDIRLKENIRGIDQSDLTKQVDLVQFNFKDSDTKKYGVIAQQLEQVGLQNLVYENDGKKAVDYISLLVLEIQRLRNEIGELKQEINKKS